MPDLRPVPPKNPKHIDIVIRKGDPSFGPKNAPITVVEFSDFECGFCSQMVPTIKRLKKEYGDKIRFVFKHLPIKFHKDAPLAAQASLAANEQGKFWEYHNLLFKNQRKLKRKHLLQYARQLKLDMTKFKAALNSKKYKQYVTDDYNQGRWWGVDGTPTFIINGKKYAGGMQYPKFKALFEKLLKNTPKSSPARK